MVYKRVLLKLSGEALAGDKKSGIYDPKVLSAILNFVKSFRHHQKWEIGIVVGAGNIWRGKNAELIGFDPAAADYMGMTATFLNSLALKDYFTQNDLPAVVLNAFAVEGLAEKTSPELAKKHLAKGEVVIFGGGTGKPFYTTDTGAALRAIDMNADLIIFVKDGVDAVYIKNPHQYKDAQKITQVTYQELIDLKVEAMDLSALEVLNKTNITSFVIGMDEVLNFEPLEEHMEIGTIITKR
ncbi:MAG: uridine monophosphate kinase [Bacilli bacterium]|jgi:uridylate kinase|nr:UMP kinase [Bacillota bacterium]NLI51951.1 UMP kinase [Erysipelotrichaceae bacterium]OQC49817.1 MAG: Uridylate kinase [Tenericutes bacterium ADurb.Bin024]HOA10988.1 UMP kinase [Bacilli bacterium]TAH58815.1 MAG: UMP kinase [Bacillota bacterium]